MDSIHLNPAQPNQASDHSWRQDEEDVSPTEALRFIVPVSTFRELTRLKLKA
jgi:hypothetical protein